MKLVLKGVCFAAVFLACGIPVFAAGVRMSADFLPLVVGNHWVYDILNEGGQKIAAMDVAIKEHRIVNGRSYYLVAGFPFSAEGVHDRLIRYDRDDHDYVALDDTEEQPLFLADGSTTDVVQADDSGLPLKFVLHLDLMDLTFQRGVGIVEAQLHAGNEVRIAKLSGAHMSDRPVGGTPEVQSAIAALPQPKAPEPKTKTLVDNVTKVSEQNPVLDVQVVNVPEGHKFVLTVINTEAKLLPFNFTSGQTYDFAVIDPVTGQEVWRWSRRMFFTQVVRAEAILPNKQWTFDVTWNDRDNDLNRLEPGKYKVQAFVATQPPIESDPVTFEITK